MSLVTVFVSSPESYSERRLSRHLTIFDLKNKLYPVTGIAPESQRLALNLAPNQGGISLSDETRTLSDYGVQEGSTIDVVDVDPSSAGKLGQYNDVSQVEKFELPDTEYAKRNDTLLAYKQRNKLGRFGDSPSTVTSPPDEPLPAGLKTGARCQVIPLSGDLSGDLPRGTVQFVGEVSFGKGGTWVGVEYDEPIGKNDGAVEGKQYFTCRPSHGAFVKPGRVQVGDYPERDPFEDEEM